jgi:hypothetical protein
LPEVTDGQLLSISGRLDVSLNGIGNVVPNYTPLPGL